MGVSRVGAKGAERVLSALTARRDELVEVFATAVADGRDLAQMGDVREAAEGGIDVILEAMRERRSLGREDVVFARPYFRHAMLRGANEADLLRSCRQMQRVMWEFLDEAAGHGAAGRAVVAELSRPLIDYVEVFSEIAAETFAEVQAAISSSRHPALGRLLDDLLAGRAVEEAGATSMRSTRPANACGRTGSGWRSGSAPFTTGCRASRVRIRRRGWRASESTATAA